MIDVLLLGNGAMLPLPERWLSSLLIRMNGSLTLFDCGEGTQVTARRFHWGFKRIDAILLSHMHADHVAGLPGLFLTVSNAGRTEPMHIYGPAGTIDVIKGLRVIAPWLRYDMVIHELADGDTFELPSGLNGTAVAGDHGMPVLAYRLDAPRGRGFLPGRAEALGVPRQQWSVLQRGEPVEVKGRVIQPEEVLSPPREGVSLGLVTDTRPTDGIRDLMRGVDLLVSEATYGDDADLPKAVEHKHMTYREAATLARDARAKHLWLTHFGASMDDPLAFADNAREVFPNVELGYAGMTGRISFDEGYTRGVEATDPASPESGDDPIAE